MKFTESPEVPEYNKAPKIVDAFIECGIDLARVEGHGYIDARRAYDCIKNHLKRFPNRGVKVYLRKGFVVLKRILE